MRADGMEGTPSHAIPAISRPWIAREAFSLNPNEGRLEWARGLLEAGPHPAYLELHHHSLS